MTTDALKALILAREAQYREAIDKIVAMLAHADQLDLADLVKAVRGLATVYGFVAPAGVGQTKDEPIHVSKKPARSYRDVVQSLSRDIETHLRAHPGQEQAPRDVRDGLGFDGADATFSAALLVALGHPNIEGLGATSSRRYRWNTAAA